MEINPSKLGNSERMITWSDDSDKNVAQTKTFRCAFCKREFSNAQALGGHMNIHRKDRAKLKEFSAENLLSLDLAKKDEENFPPPPDSSAGKRLSSDDDQSLGGKAEDLDGAEEDSVRSLPLFAEAPPVNGGCGNFDKHVVSRKVELIDDGELDLELRLWPEPHHHAKSKP